jgi:hypothetical protein
LIDAEAHAAPRRPGAPDGSPADGHRLLARLRALDVPARVGPLQDEVENAALAEWERSGVSFAASSAQMEERYYQAVRELLSCIKPTAGTGPILNEGGIYLGCWLGEHGHDQPRAAVAFIPSVAERTYAGFAEHQRVDGLFPYKLTATGPVFSQIQLVTPLARSVWNHFQLNGRDRAFLHRMYDAMARYERLARHLARHARHRRG